MKVIVVSGVLIHVVLLLSIFDIYFKSPIINDVAPCTTKGKAPAKRLVLFVADGLRMESLIDTKESALEDIRNVAPYLSSLVTLKGSWGVSVTRVPTESRPGHVALAAGFYEDPSAVLKGWKENTMEFDTIFNQSTFSWAWGSPDIVTMFAKGASKNHVYIDTYNPEDEDFSGSKSTALLDTWVFDKVEEFLKSNQFDGDSKLANDKIVFFLHLLGLDTAGHTHKPGSKEYFENIKVVDDGIQKMEELFETFFTDRKTAYVFTADHGMTDWGSHGAGSSSETDTPFITWGAGIRRNTQLHEIEQADIAPFMATLIGVPVPVNSLGVVPIEFLDIPEQDIAYALFANAQQMCTLFDEKQRRVEDNSWRLFFKPFLQLSPHDIQQSYHSISNAMESLLYQDAIIQSRSLIEMAKKGLDYYQNYYQKLLLTCTTLSYIGWILILLVNIMSRAVYEGIGEVCSTRKLYNTIVTEYCEHCYMHYCFIIVLLFGLFALASQKLPFMFYLHCMLPIFMWWSLLIQLRTSSINYAHIKLNSLFLFLFWSSVYLIGTEILVFSFFERRILSVPLVVISLWPYLVDSWRTNSIMRFAWFLSSLALSIFPLLPLIGTYNSAFIVMFQIMLWINLIVMIMLKHYPIRRNDTTADNILIYVMIAVYFVTFINILYIEACTVFKIGLPIFNQFCSWLLLICSFLLPLYASFYVQSRLTFIKVSLAIPVILLSVSYEPLFLLILSTNLFVWLVIEDRLAHGIDKDLSELQFVSIINNMKLPRLDAAVVYITPVEQKDFRRAYFFLFYIILSFFGTGNIASINSFDPTWVRNFVSVFSPFTMTALILVKVVIPFLVVSCTFRAITVAVKAPIRQLFLIVLMLGDIMGLQFLYFVKNEGSWLEIGTSISHFVIVQSIVVFLIIFYCIATLLTESGLAQYKHCLKKRN